MPAGRLVTETLDDDDDDGGRAANAYLPPDAP